MEDKLQFSNSKFISESSTTTHLCADSAVDDVRRSAGLTNRLCSRYNETKQFMQGRQAKKCKLRLTSWLHKSKMTKGCVMQRSTGVIAKLQQCLSFS